VTGSDNSWTKNASRNFIAPGGALVMPSLVPGLFLLLDYLKEQVYESTPDTAQYDDHHDPAVNTHLIYLLPLRLRVSPTSG
jgi:hypothetical protein